MERAIVGADQIHSPDRVPSGTISKTLRDLGSVHAAGVVVPALDAAITTDTTAGTREGQRTLGAEYTQFWNHNIYLPYLFF